MLKLSHVCLAVTLPMDRTGTPEEITEHLGVRPTSVKRSVLTLRSPDGRTKQHAPWTWMLASPEDETRTFQSRVQALLASISPFGDRLRTLDSKFAKSIDCLFHCTFEPPMGFDMIMLSTEQLRLLADLNLSFACETVWWTEEAFKQNMKT